MKNLKTEGGLRTLGEFHKKSEFGRPLISIITVVRNGEKYLEQTIQSVINQTYKNIEYIIIDGLSTDGTLNIIRKHGDQVAYWMSEPDSGMYDAMNKGSYVASGDYALFLNSDDYLYHENSIEEILRLGLDGDEQPLLIVGQMAIAVKDKLFPDWIYPSSEKQINRDNPPHPGTLVVSAIYKQIPYNCSFKLAGDYDFWETLRQKNLFQVKYVDSIISVFRMGGISNCGKREFLVSVELEISKYMHYGDFSVIRLINSFARASIKKVLVRIMGESRYYRYVPYNKYRFRKRFLRQ
ncbi:MAG: glycosyltransferase [Candidatus Omnitrophica bacterium]|nr:glycosyltransferase [Candidatus Omnitrophota bacterium]